VRIKSGLYAGDLGLVEQTAANNKVWLRVIPRIELNPNKVAADSKAKQTRFMSVRPPQKPLTNEDARRLLPGQQLETKNEPDLRGKAFIIYKKQNFRKGFLYKQFNIKQLDVDSTVRPGVEEVQAFAKIITNSSSSGLLGKTAAREDSSGDEGLTGEELIKRTFLLEGS